MPNSVKQAFLRTAEEKLGTLKKLEGSLSLYRTDAGPLLYVRYSRVHEDRRAFYGLREQDLRLLAGEAGLLCFLWPGQEAPLLVPFADFEEVIEATAPASDGQYKVQMYFGQDGTELYIAQAGRFSVEGYLGWDKVENRLGPATSQPANLSHPQVQTLLGSIGAAKGFGVWIPPADRVGLDWSISRQFTCWRALPPGVEGIASFLEEVDVIWLQRGSSELHSLFEIEHSTPVYSGLLRLNDVLLLRPEHTPGLHIVANDTRRSAFARQVNRPTFRASGLDRLCTFMEYQNVFGWHRRVMGQGAG